MRCALLVLMSLGLVACSATADESDETNDAVEGGHEVSAEYPEVVHIAIAKPGGAADCAGVLVAPKLVLTAGHCVDGMSDWAVHSPGVPGDEHHEVEQGEIFDWAASCGSACTDLALLTLKTPIVLSSYPRLRFDRVPEHTRAISVGKRIDGAHGSGVYATPGTPLVHGEGAGYARSYVREDGLLEHGDSGGPTFLAGAKEHTVIGINMAILRSPRRDFIQRFDARGVSEWLAMRIREGSPRASGNGRTTRQHEPPPPAAPGAVTCTHEGRRLQVGETAPWRCNECTCRDLRGRGEMMCTSMTCA